MSKELLTDVFTVIRNEKNLSVPDWKNRYREKFIDFCEKKVGDGNFYKIAVTRIKDYAEYCRHQFYRGYLLPAIAREVYDGVLAKAHYELKKMFLFYEVADWSEIPKKYYDRITLYTRTDVETGIDVLTGYSPSTAVISDDRFIQFIQDVLWLVAEKEIQVGFDIEGCWYYRQGFMIKEAV